MRVLIMRFLYYRPFVLFFSSNHQFFVRLQVQYGPPSSPQSSWTTAAQAATGDQQYTAHSPTSQLASFSLGTNQQSYQQQCTMPQQDNHLEEGTLALDLFNLLQVSYAPQRVNLISI